MSNPIISANISENDHESAHPAGIQSKPVKKPVWETPKLEDVSEQVMAQPYIRFT